MEEYSELLSKINTYLKLPNLAKNDISVFDLYVIIKNELNMLEERKNALLFSMRNEQKDLFNITVNLQDDDIVLNFSYYDLYTKRFTYKSVVKRNDCANIIYEDCSLEPYLIDKYYDKICSILDAKYLHSFVYKLSLDSIKEKLGDDFLAVSLTYDKYKIDIPSIRIRSGNDKSNIYNKKIGNLDSLKSIVDSNAKLILQNIKVDLNKLSLTTKKILVNSKLTKDCIKVKKRKKL